jgi:hypothetical protein
MSSIDRAVELLTVSGIVSITIDKIRLLQEQAAAQLGSEWVAENGPHLPMETIKTGMVSVHTEYQALQAEWARLMLTLRSRKADTEAVEKAMIMLAAVALRLAMDIRAQAVRTGTYVLDDKRERQPAEEVFAALSE